MSSGYALRGPGVRSIASMGPSAFAPDAGPFGVNALDCSRAMFSSHIGLHREVAGDVGSARKVWREVLARYHGNPHTRMTEVVLSQRG